MKGLTIGVPTHFYVDDLEPDVAATLDATIKTFEKLGARIVTVDLPDQTAVAAAALVVLAVEAAALHAPWLRTRAEDYTPQVRNRLENGLGLQRDRISRSLALARPRARRRISTRSAMST